MNISTVLGDKFALSFPGTFIIFNCFCLLLGVCGNCGVIHHALMNYDMTPNSVLVSNLAVTDLLVCLTTYPIWMADMIEYIQGIDENVEFCKFSHSSGCVALGLAVFALVSIILDRYIFIMRPLKYPLIMTLRRTYTLRDGSSMIW
jgi:hypothetical protein